MRLGPSVSGYLRSIAEDIEYFSAPEPLTVMSAKLPHTPTPDEKPMAHPVPTLKPVTPASTGSSKLPDTIQTAATKKIEAEMQPVGEKIERLKKSLDSFHAAVRLETEDRITSSILVALGQEPLPVAETEEARKTLRTALLEVYEIVGGVSPFASTTRAVEAPPASSEAPEPTKTLAELYPDPKPSELAHAKRLIGEIEGMSGKVKGQHPTRFQHLLQAMVAEARLLMSQLPVGHPLGERLSQLIPVLGAMKTENGVQDFIQGLAFGAQGDWTKVASESRRKVAQYDRDVASVASTIPAPPKSSPKPQKSEKATLLSWPKLPRLRLAMQSKPLIIVGGLVVNEKLDLCASRFGIKPVWHETDGDAVRSAEILAKRIRAGAPCAVIVLEGLVSHKTSDKIIDACKSNRVPFVLGDKGGTGSIENALHQIEQKLAG